MNTNFDFSRNATILALSVVGKVKHESGLAAQRGNLATAIKSAVLATSSKEERASFVDSFLKAGKAALAAMPGLEPEELKKALRDFQNSFMTIAHESGLSTASDGSVYKRELGQKGQFRWFTQEEIQATKDNAALKRGLEKDILTRAEAGEVINGPTLKTLPDFVRALTDKELDALLSLATGEATNRIAAKQAAAKAHAGETAKVSALAKVAKANDKAASKAARAKRSPAFQRMAIGA